MKKTIVGTVLSLAFVAGVMLFQGNDREIEPGTNTFQFRDTPGAPGIKRVIGLPGDHIAIRDGVAYLNGQPLAAEERLTP